MPFPLRGRAWMGSFVLVPQTNLLLQPLYRTPFRMLSCAASDPGRVETAPHIPVAKPNHLYLVSTPIGNARDITLRARDILSTSDVIAAEDTRRAGKLLKTLSSRPENQRLISCHEHNWRSRIPALLSHLAQGHSVAFVSDAGTPCVSDPGAELISAAIHAGAKIVPLPGACAAIAALVASGMPVSGFTFIGFLPRAGSARRLAFDQLAGNAGTVILYEAPHRLVSTLKALSEMKDEKRAICLGRELTKKWEEFLRFDNAAQAYQFYQQEGVEPRGEFTIVIAPLTAIKPNRDDITAYSKADVDLPELIRRLVDNDVPVSTIARCISAVSDAPKKLVYAYAIELNQKLRADKIT